MPTLRGLMPVLLALAALAGCGGGDGNNDIDSGTDGDTEAVVSDCDGGRYDEATGLCWQHPKASETYEWQEAIDYCDGLDLGGHTDWVLPTRQNFIDMLGGCDSAVLGEGNGYCNTCAASATCSALFGADTDLYWSSSSYNSPIGGDAWGVNFDGGNLYDTDKVVTLYVRCVRSGP